jgi:SAM-dependent methyltransferase
LAQTILERASPAAVIAVDSSDPLITHAVRHARDRRLGFEPGHAERLPFDAMAFDAVVSGLVLNFVGEPGRAVAEMLRVLRPGGTGAVSVWDYSDGMQLLRHFWDAAVALDPNARHFDEGRRFPLCKREPLRALFRAYGFDQVQALVVDVPTVFANFDDYWLPFLGGQGPAPTYCGMLADDRRTLLRDQVRASLPMQHDGSIALSARAIAVRGVRPAS